MAVTVRNFAGEVKLINLSYDKRCNNFIGTGSVFTQHNLLFNTNSLFKFPY